MKLVSKSSTGAPDEHLTALGFPGHTSVLEVSPVLDYDVLQAIDAHRHRDAHLQSSTRESSSKDAQQGGVRESSSPMENEVVPGIVQNTYSGATNLANPLDELRIVLERTSLIGAPSSARTGNYYYQRQYRNVSLVW